MTHFRCFNLQSGFRTGMTIARCFGEKTSLCRTKWKCKNLSASKNASLKKTGFRRYRNPSRFLARMFSPKNSSQDPFWSILWSGQSLFYCLQLPQQNKPAPRRLRKKNPITAKRKSPARAPVVPEARHIIPPLANPIIPPASRVPPRIFSSLFIW